jgi:hypothetical protein
MCSPGPKAISPFLAVTLEARQEMTLVNALAFLALVSAIVWLSANLTWRRVLAIYAATALFVNLVLLAAILSPLVALACLIAGTMFIVLKVVQRRRPFRGLMLRFLYQLHNTPMPPTFDGPKTFGANRNWYGRKLQR